jgi:hypothetical protein
MSFGFFLNAQIEVPRSELLSKERIKSIFTDSIRQALGVDYPIYMACKYWDAEGTHYMVFTEKEYDRERTEILNDTIKALNISYKNNHYYLNWELTDFKLAENEVSEEHSIGFWPKYFALNDFDQDGLMDAIIVYGTFGDNGTDDGRIKIVAHTKGKKRAIFHQNGISSSERFTLVDRRFYDLAYPVQQKVFAVMESMEINEHAYFPYCWEESMARKEVRFDEHSW